MSKTFFEITLTYYDYDSESTSNRLKKFTEVIGCYAYNYTEAELIATQWGNENIDVNYKISPIKELDISNIIRSEDETGLWYIVKGIWIDNNSNKPKEYKVNYLVQDRNPSDAGKRALKILEGIFFVVRIADVKETKLSFVC